MRHRDTGRLSVLFSLGAAAVLAACSGDDGVAPPPTLEPSFKLVNVFYGMDLTPDGSIALLQQYNATADFYFYHTDTGDLEFKGQAGDGARDIVWAISANRAVTGIHGVPTQAGIWTQRGGWTDLPSVFPLGCGDEVASAWDITANGRSVVGMAWNECGVQAFRWDGTGSGVMTLLQLVGSNWSPERAPDNRPNAISDDGSLIGGWASTAATGRAPAIWHADGTGELLTGMAPEFGGEVMGISADGRVAVGYWGENAFYWTQAGGTVSIGRLPAEEGDFGGGMANTVSLDGKLIFGVSGQPFFGKPKAFVWTQAGGIRPLADVVTAAGLTIPEGVTLTNVLASSTDGTVVLGQATMSDFSIQSFVLRLPVSAYGL